MKMAYLSIPGDPMAKQRHRVTKKGRAYTPAQTVNYENLVKYAYKSLNSDIFWDCEPISMHILAVFRIPKSYSKKKVSDCLSGKIAPSTKDVDNIAKIICDGLNNVAYSDDKHIAELYVAKCYSADPKKYGVKITIKDFKIENINAMYRGVE